MSINVKAYGALSQTAPEIVPLDIQRHEPGPDEVLLKIAFCGVCHTDIHYVHNEWGVTTYPVVPGHEIVGHVERIGANVKKFKINDTAGVGCLVNSCGQCANCHANAEQYCPKLVLTYGSQLADGSPTHGGYSQYITIKEDFLLKIPKNLNLAATAPLLCAGITTWSPLHSWNVGKGQKVGVVGLGGLGHMGVKLAAALGAQVTVISTSPSKKNDALKLGAHDFIVSSDEAAVRAQADSFDLILDTVSANHNIIPLVNLLKTFGKYAIVGAPNTPLQFQALALIGKNRVISGSTIGGIKETQEMLDFCGQNNIVSDIEMISVNQVDEAYKRVLKSDVKYRFVIDISTI